MATDYEHLQGKRVTVKEAGGDPYEAVLVTASGLGVLVKPKGTSTSRLIEAEQLESLEAVPEKPSTLRQKAMDEVTPEKARRHLLDYHGIALSQVNGVTDADAHKMHAEMDHSDTGHNHNGRKKADDKASETEANGEE